jgi:hypothetical protein
VEPALVRIAGSRGDNAMRRLLLRSPIGSDEPRVFTQDLTDADGVNVLPAAAISVTFPVDRPIEPPLAADLTVALGHTPSGRYTGEILFFGEGSEASFALDVAVKDRPFWPLLTLLMGVILGMAITAYRQRMGPRDRLLVAISDAVREAEEHEALRDGGRGEEFRRRLDLHANDAGAALRSNAFDSAEKHLKLAQRVVLLWTREESGWFDALERRDALLQTLEKEAPFAESDAAYLSDLRAATSAALAEIIEQATTGELADFSGSLSERYDASLRTLHERMIRYRNFLKTSEALHTLLEGLPADEARRWRETLAAQESALAALRPASSAEDAAKLAALVAEQQKTAAQIRDLTESATHEMDRPVAGESRPEEAAASWSPLQVKIREEKRVQQARMRTYGALAISFIVAAGLLGGAGFQELYVANPVFGDRRWFDYFTLLVWGLGAEATTSSISGLLRSWNLPFIGQGKESGAS